jgi:hypothetical protein
VVFGQSSAEHHFFGMRGGDFKRHRRGKVGKKSLKAANETRLDVVIRKVRVPAQEALVLAAASESADEGAHREVALKAQMSQSSHHNASMRKDAVRALVTLVGGGSVALVHAGELLGVAAMRLTDPDHGVRRVAADLLAETVGACPKDMVRPFVPLLAAHCASGLAGLAPDVRLDALAVVMVLAKARLAAHPAVLGSIVPPLAELTSVAPHSSGASASSRLVSATWIPLFLDRRLALGADVVVRTSSTGKRPRSSDGAPPPPAKRALLVVAAADDSAEDVSLRCLEADQALIWKRLQSLPRVQLSPTEARIAVAIALGHVVACAMGSDFEDPMLLARELDIPTHSTVSAAQLPIPFAQPATPLTQPPPSSTVSISAALGMLTLRTAVREELVSLRQHLLGIVPDKPPAATQQSAVVSLHTVLQHLAELSTELLERIPPTGVTLPPLSLCARIRALLTSMGVLTKLAAAIDDSAGRRLEAAAVREGWREHPLSNIARRAVAPLADSFSSVGAVSSGLAWAQVVRTELTCHLVATQGGISQQQVEAFRELVEGSSQLQYTIPDDFDESDPEDDDTALGTSSFAALGTSSFAALGTSSFAALSSSATYAGMARQLRHHEVLSASQLSAVQQAARTLAKQRRLPPQRAEKLMQHMVDVAAAQVSTQQSAANSDQKRASHLAAQLAWVKPAVFSAVRRLRQVVATSEAEASFQGVVETAAILLKQLLPVLPPAVVRTVQVTVLDLCERFPSLAIPALDLLDMSRSEDSMSRSEDIVSQRVVGLLPRVAYAAARSEDSTLAHTVLRTLGSHIAASDLHGPDTAATSSVLSALAVRRRVSPASAEWGSLPSLSEATQAAWLKAITWGGGPRFGAMLCSQPKLFVSIAMAASLPGLAPSVRRDLVSCCALSIMARDEASSVMPATLNAETAKHVAAFCLSATTGVPLQVVQVQQGDQIQGKIVEADPIPPPIGSSGRWDAEEIDGCDAFGLVLSLGSSPSELVAALEEAARVAFVTATPLIQARWILVLRGRDWWGRSLAPQLCAHLLGFPAAPTTEAVSRPWTLSQFALGAALVDECGGASWLLEQALKPASLLEDLLRGMANVLEAQDLPLSARLVEEIRANAGPLRAQLFPRLKDSPAVHRLSEAASVAGCPID